MMKKNFLIILILLMSALSSAEEEPFVYNDNGRRDPFWPLISTTGSFLSYDTDYVISDLILEGIMMGASSDKSLAIINGRIVKHNDKIGQYVIVEITPDTVTLLKDEQKFTLKLSKGD